jgi:hypothetical protein
VIDLRRVNENSEILSYKSMPLATSVRTVFYLGRSFYEFVIKLREGPAISSPVVSIAGILTY